MDELLRIPDLARQVKLSEATVSRYIKEYIDYIPHTEIRGELYFTSDVLPMLQHINSMKKERKVFEIISESLKENFPQVIDAVMEVPQQQANKELSTEVLGQVMQAIAQQGNILQQMVQAMDKSREIAELQGRVDVMEERNRKLDEVLRKLNEKKGFVQRVKEFFGRD